ncbi:unnamed protein product [Amaranthus hypochondriacus]
MITSTISSQEENYVPQSNLGSKILLMTRVQSEAGENHIPKIRKAYTITKQRERWTEDEHKRFLEALKMYGRAWRKIEEHVGSKTAVQIRSHAQKFFSKVVRETSTSNSISAEPIEIPPPRPKRKPSHPYPRKLVLPSRKEMPMEHQARSTSPNSSFSEQDNHSPASVMSFVASDTIASADSATPKSSLSPISSGNFADQVAVMPCENNASQGGLLLPNSLPIAPSSVKLELFSYKESSEKEDVASTKVLKLFGKDLVVPRNPSDSSTCSGKSTSSDMGEGVLQAYRNASKSGDIAVATADYQTFFSADRSTNQVEKPVPLPWWIFFKGINISPFGKPQEKEILREDSSADSNSDSVNRGETPEKNWEVEAESGICSPSSDKDGQILEESSPKTLEPTSLEKRTSFDDGRKGFVPYKRCLSKRDMQFSTITSEERESQRIRLCL